MASNRDERIENYYNWPAWDLAERIVDLEEAFMTMTQVDDNRLKRIKQLEDQNEELRKHPLIQATISTELDPERLESALRMYVAELDYDIHKAIESPEDGGPDRYPEEVQFFLRCWDTAGEG